MPLQYASGFKPACVVAACARLWCSWSCHARPAPRKQDFPPWRAGWRSGPPWPFEVTGSRVPGGEARDPIPPITHTCQQDTHRHIHACMHICKTHNLLPKKIPPTPVSSKHMDLTHISGANADKGQAGSSQSAPGSVLIKEQVVTPSMHSGLSQEKNGGG